VSEERKVQIEAVAWVTKFVGGDGSRRVVFEEVAEPGDTVRVMLRRLSARFPELDAALWDRQSGELLGEHIEIIVNDAVLGVERTLDSQVRDGDRITLLGQYTGG
jgi:molybdopterin converting factor small subunit